MQPVYDPHTTRLSSSLAPKLFVGQVPKRYGEEELRALFSTCGPVLDVTVIRCKRTLSHKGCAFVLFLRGQDAMTAIERFHKKISLPPRKKRLQVRVAHGELETQLFVKHVPDSATEEDLRAAFERYGPLRSVKLMTNETGAHSGVAFVEFFNREDMVQAEEDTNGRLIMQSGVHPLLVRAALPRLPRNFMERTRSMPSAPATEAAPVPVQVPATGAWPGESAADDLLVAAKLSCMSITAATSASHAAPYRPAMTAAHAGAGDSETEGRTPPYHVLHASGPAPRTGAPQVAAAAAAGGGAAAAAAAHHMMEHQPSWPADLGSTQHIRASTATAALLARAQLQLHAQQELLMRDLHSYDSRQMAEQLAHYRASMAYSASIAASRAASMPAAALHSSLTAGRSSHAAATAAAAAPHYHSAAPQYHSAAYQYRSEAPQYHPAPPILPIPTVPMLEPPHAGPQAASYSMHPMAADRPRGASHPPPAPIVTRRSASLPEHALLATQPMWGSAVESGYSAAAYDVSGPGFIPGHAHEQPLPPRGGQYEGHTASPPGAAAPPQHMAAHVAAAMHYAFPMSAPGSAPTRPPPAPYTFVPPAPEWMPPSLNSAPARGAHMPFSASTPTSSYSEFGGWFAGTPASSSEPPTSRGLGVLEAARAVPVTPDAFAAATPQSPFSGM